MFPSIICENFVVFCQTMYLVCYHMFQPLVICRADKNLRPDLFTCPSIIHNLITISFHSRHLQYFRDILNGTIVIWRRISESPNMTPSFSHNTFHKLRNSHTRWNGVRIHNNIRHNSILGIWHILVFICHTNSSLLSTTTGTFIANLRLPVLADSHFAELVAFAIDTVVIHINISVIIRFHSKTAILI